MFNIVTSELEFAGKKLVLEYGKLARQADSAVMVSYGKTKILCTVVFKKDAEVVNDFFPLTVAYMERYHATGRIPGGFVKRETKPNEGEILISRLIDRSIRPLFDENFLNEVQVACTVFSYEHDTTPEFIALVGAVAALRTTSLPFHETVTGIRIALVNGEFVANPSSAVMNKSSLDMFVSTTKESILMVESEAFEVSEEDMVKAVDFAITENAKVISLIDEFAEKVNGEKGLEKITIEKADTSAIEEKMSAEFSERLSAAFEITAKKERNVKLDEIKSEVKKMFLTETAEGKEIKEVLKLFKELEKKIVRKKIVFENKRIDGRDSKTIRPILAEAGILPAMVHGSALFTRGETQALISITIGNEKDEQMVDTMSEGLTYDRFSLHYNFPGYSVGEVARFGAPGRREIGHGNLAKKAIRPMLPSKDEYPFAIRAVSDILESNGSSSMATVCGVSIGLMSAGVPLRKPVSGIAMGLVKEEESFTILSDILGDEDALGDMDFKVAGTVDGITALQMDIKIRGITPEIMKEALMQAKEGREHIRNKMAEAITEPSEVVNENAPKMKMITVPENMIRLLIGPGGSVIKDLCSKSGANIDISKTGGNVKVSAPDVESVDVALKMIDSIVNPPKEEMPPVDEGAIYNGVVKKILDGYILVKLENGASGYVYGYDISYSRFDKIEDVVLVGEKVKTKVLSSNDSEIKLSLKFVDQETGRDISTLYNKQGE
jgi:polyribonucleotide nucleotidyltransferase